MPLVVVGGHARNIGKTSVMAGLIAATREQEWTAVKITQFGHGICSADGQACECTTDDHTIALSEEKKLGSGKDTSRYLAAGAQRAFWLRVRQGQLFEAVPRLRTLIAGSRNVILESNSILQFVRPDVYISVLDDSVEDFKTSARRFLDRADLVLHRRETQGEGTWAPGIARVLRAVPSVAFTPPEYVPEQAVAFLRDRLERLNGDPARADKVDERTMLVAEAPRS